MLGIDEDGEASDLCGGKEAASAGRYANWFNPGFDLRLKPM